MAEETGLAIQKIRDQIIRLEGRPPVMLARDLAEIYQVNPKQITEAVRRNPDRFPDDFVFRLTEGEISALKNEDRLSMQVTEAPLAFTREGANQLSGCLKSKVAAERSIQIMRAFSVIEERAQQVQGSGDILLDSIKALGQLREHQIETQKALAAQAQTLTTHDRALATQSNQIKAIAATQDSELRLTAEQEKNLNALVNRLITTRAFARKRTARDVAPSIWSWLKTRMGIRTLAGMSRAQYPVAADLLRSQITREEAEVGQVNLLKPKDF